MSGKFKSFSNDTVVLSQGSDPDTSYKVSPNATVTLNGKTAKMTDLAINDNVVLSGDPATSVSVTH